MLNPIQKIMQRKIANKGKCEVCDSVIGERADFLCKWCRNMKNLESNPHRRPNNSAKKCTFCGKVLSKEDKELSKEVKKDICWNQKCIKKVKVKKV